MHPVTASATLGVYATGDRSLAPATTSWPASDVEIGGPLTLSTTTGERAPCSSLLEAQGFSRSPGQPLPI
jgi:hypothetical protein